MLIGDFSFTVENKNLEIFMNTFEGVRKIPPGQSPTGEFPPGSGLGLGLG